MPPEATPPVDATQPAPEIPEAAPSAEATTTDPAATTETPDSSDGSDVSDSGDIYDQIVATMAPESPTLPDSYTGVTISNAELERLLGSTGMFRFGQRAFINDLTYALSSKNGEYQLSKNETDWLLYNHEKHAAETFKRFAKTYEEAACSQVFDCMDYEPFLDTNAQKLHEEIAFNRKALKEWGVKLDTKMLLRLPLGKPLDDGEPPELKVEDVKDLKYKKEYKAMAQILDAYVAHGYEEEVVAFLTAVKTQAPEIATKIKKYMQHNYTSEVSEANQTVTLTWLDETYTYTVAVEVPDAQPGQAAPPIPPKPTREALEAVARGLINDYEGEDLSEVEKAKRTVDGITYVLTSTDAPVGEDEPPVVPDVIVGEVSASDGPDGNKTFTEAEPVKIKIQAKEDTTVTVDAGGVEIDVPVTKSEAPQEVQVLAANDPKRKEIGYFKGELEIIKVKDQTTSVPVKGEIILEGEKKELAIKETAKVLNGPEFKKGDKIKIEVESTEDNVKLKIAIGPVTTPEIQLGPKGKQTKEIELTDANWTSIGKEWSGKIKIVEVNGQKANIKLEPKVTVKGEVIVEPPPPPPPGEQSASAHPKHNKISSLGSPTVTKLNEGILTFDLDFKRTIKGYVEIKDIQKALKILSGEDAANFKRIPYNCTGASYSGGILRYTVSDTGITVKYKIRGKVNNLGGGSYKISWSNVPGSDNDFTENEGYWLLKPVTGYKDLYELTWYAHTVSPNVPNLLKSIVKGKSKAGTEASVRNGIAVLSAL